MTQKKITAKSGKTEKQTSQKSVDTAKPAKKRWTNWTAGDFVLQLGTVIIGILVTFGGSTLLTKRAERRDTNYILEMVRGELEHNLGRIKFIKERLEYELAGTQAMKPYIESPESMPLDSLQKYINVIQGVRDVQVMTNSFDVMKSSSQIQSIRNKKLLRDLFVMYESLTEFQSRIDEYNSPKTKAIKEEFSLMSRETLDALYFDEDRERTVFVEMLKLPSMHHFIVLIANGNFAHLIQDADDIAAEIQKVIELIDKEVEQ